MTRVWRFAAIVGLCLWCLSLALPVYQNRLVAGPEGAGLLFGWRVLFMAPAFLAWPVTFPWLANLLGLVSVAWVAWRGASPKGLATTALLTACSLLIWWPWNAPQAFLHAGDLRIGCWVWVASFLPMAFADLVAMAPPLLATRR
jgi:hypothetical protein